MRTVRIYRLLLRRPPRSTPFPTRRSSDLDEIAACERPEQLVQARALLRHELQHQQSGDEAVVGVEVVAEIVMARDRSEEHTSELQSHSDLVCRLLLEKKKNKNKYTIVDNI